MIRGGGITLNQVLAVFGQTLAVRVSPLPAKKIDRCELSGREWINHPCHSVSHISSFLAKAHDTDFYISKYLNT